MSDVRSARKRLKDAQDLLQDPIPEHHPDVRLALLSAYQTLTDLSHLNFDPPHKALVFQDFRLNHNWSRDLIQDALSCLDEMKTESSKRLNLLTAAAEYVREAYLLI
ncbi:hypothetical protein [Deinococcus roseus]|uniref:Molecular chaperone DnaJ n=1 Tax=Deinococcus roseus TaxID=392414 RepID=A0ABQ2D4E3_9DEIO|nr:hypothetical protein [Deinococcus roseus]GGJ42760.1 hypothetical protein GCM10008938_31150 [Deinococcus roseus]